MVIGVCGKIASGKTEIMKILKGKGFSCIYADDIVHELYKEGRHGHREIKQHFGKDFVHQNGDIDRLKLREYVFQNPKELEKLNRIIHPLVYAEILKGDIGANVAIESVYFEGVIKGFVDKIVWVSRPKEAVKKTLLKDRGFSEDLAEKAYSFIEEPKQVDFYIDNSSTLKDLNLLVCSKLGL